MEEKPNIERKIKKSEVVELLKARGIDNLEVKKFFMDWTLQRERETDKGTPRDRIIFNVERAEVYLAIGDNEEFLNALDDALRQALQHNEADLYNQIIKMY
ncbi:MAG: hypothetical protein P4L63_03280 [Candidatus Pacebacteria bacterium]|nr:hypothetical protein [Candidatus Paceibacterota bacterium]